MKIDVEIVKPALRNCRHRCEGALSNRLNETRMMGPLDVKYWLDWPMWEIFGRARGNQMLIVLACADFNTLTLHWI